MGSLLIAVSPLSAFVFEAVGLSEQFDNFLKEKPSKKINNRVRAKNYFRARARGS